MKPNRPNNYALQIIKEISKEVSEEDMILGMCYVDPITKKYYRMLGIIPDDILKDIFPFIQIVSYNINLNEEE